MAKPSAESLSIAAVSIPKRIEPFDYLNDNQMRIWRDVTYTKPPEWFEADSAPLLAAYAVAVDLHESLTKKINSLDITDKDLERLTLLKDKQANLMAGLAVKMRLTQQSRYTPQAAATANKKTASGQKPWEA